MANWANRRAAFDDLRESLRRWSISDSSVYDNIDKLDALKGVTEVAADLIRKVVDDAIRDRNQQIAGQLKPVSPPAIWTPAPTAGIVNGQPLESSTNGKTWT